MAGDDPSTLDARTRRALKLRMAALASVDVGIIQLTIEIASLRLTFRIAAPSAVASAQIASVLSSSLATSQNATAILQSAQLTVLDTPIINAVVEAPAPPPSLALSPPLAQTVEARSVGVTVAIVVVLVLVIAVVAAAVMAARRHLGQRGIAGCWRGTHVRFAPRAAAGRGVSRGGGAIVLAQPSPFQVSAHVDASGAGKTDDYELQPTAVHALNGMGDLQIHTDFSSDAPQLRSATSGRSSDSETAPPHRSRSSSVGQRFSCADLGRQLTTPSVPVVWRPNLEHPDHI